MPFLFFSQNKSGTFSLPRFYNDPQKLSPHVCIQTTSRKELQNISQRERAWNIPSLAGRKQVTSSMTIEASLCLTIFLVFMISLCQLFMILQLQMKIQKALEQVGNEAAQYSYITSQVPLWDSESQLIQRIREYLMTELSEEALRLRFVDVMGQQVLDDSIVVGGAQGVSFEDSKLLQEQGVLQLVASYSIRLPIAVWGFDHVTLQQQCYRYGLLGDREPAKKQTNEEAMVYVTKYGEVYHVTLSCTHLNLSVRSVSMSQVASLRNDNGAIYQPCELCRPTGREDAVYLTREGDRYHDELTCGGIRRHISAIPMSQIQDRRPCSRCGKEAS